MRHDIGKGCKNGIWIMINDNDARDKSLDLPLAAS
jgi:hypothetical protein